jgi:hypothetical protein
MRNAPVVGQRFGRWSKPNAIVGQTTDEAALRRLWLK